MTIGMTLAALQDIGREVGISPDSLSRAARSFSDSDWEVLVADLRTTFEALGAVRYDGPFRQWTNGNLQALAEGWSAQ